MKIYYYFILLLLPSNELFNYMFIGNETHTAIYTSSPIVEPSVKWKFKTNGYNNSSPLIIDGKIIFGSSDSNLYCLSKDGDLVWKFKTEGPVASSPAVKNRRIFFLSFDGNCYCLDLNGQLVWKYKTEGEKYFSAPGIHGQLPKDSMFIDEWDFWLSSPLVDDQFVYFGSGDACVYALDVQNGKLKWRYRTQGIVHSSPALAYGNIYVGSFDTYFYAINAATGKLRWRFQTGQDTVIHNQTGITSSPLIADSVVYFGCRDSHLYALNAISGDSLWSHYNNRGWISVTPIKFDRFILYGSGSDKEFDALDARTGKIIYSHKMNSAIFSSPVIVNDCVIYGDMSGYLHARKVNNGEIAWSLKVSDVDPYHIINQDMQLNKETYMAAMEKYDGKLSPMQIRLSACVFLSSPVIDNGVIYIGGTDHYFYAIK